MPLFIPDTESKFFEHGGHRPWTPRTPTARMDIWGGVSDDTMESAMEGMDEPAAAQTHFIYLRRGMRASDDGGQKVQNGHYKIGRTKEDDVSRRKTDGSMPASSYPIAKWSVPSDKACELETQLHDLFADLRIELGSGREWFTWQKVLDQSKGMCKDFATQEKYLVTMIDGSLGIRHEPVEPPVDAPGKRKRRRQVRGAPPARRNKKGADDGLTKLMLDTWHPPTNSPPEAMLRALRDAILDCTILPPRARGRASKTTAKSSRIVVNLAAAFMRYTEWDGRSIDDIRQNAKLKQYLSASACVENRLFDAGSDCGNESGSQGINWVHHVAALSAQKTEDHVFVRMIIGEKTYVWNAQWLE